MHTGAVECRDAWPEGLATGTWQSTGSGCTALRNCSDGKLRPLLLMLMLMLMPPPHDARYIQAMVQQASGRRTPATSSGTRGSAALSTPANLQLSGAWGFYESRHQEDNLSIRALEQEARDLSASSRDLKKQLEEALAQLSASQDTGGGFRRPNGSSSRGSSGT